MFAGLVASAKEAVSRRITAIGLWAVAAVLVIVALAYFVGSLHHWLLGKLGPIGADAVLGAVFLVIAGIAMLAAWRMGRPAPVRVVPMSPIAGMLEVARQGTAMRFGAEFAQRMGPVQRVGLGLLVGFIVARGLKRARGTHPYA
jgi:hypothetical protein